MLIEKITLKIDKEEFERVLSILEKLSDSLPYFKYWSVKYGSLGDDILVTLSVDGENLDRMLEKISLNKITILPLDEKTKELMNKSTRKHTSNIDLVEKVWKKANKTQIERYITQGNYKDIIKISRDPRQNPDVRSKAKESIGVAVSAAIDLSFNNAMKNIEAARDCIRELVEISADKKLLPFQEVDLMKHAGMTAINLSTFFDEYNSELIRIINNSSVPNIVSVTAAGKAR